MDTIVVNNVESVMPENVLNQLPGAVFIKKVSGGVSSYTWVNQFTARMMGFVKATDVVGMSEAEIPFLSHMADDINSFDRQALINNNGATFLNIGSYKVPDTAGLIVKKQPFVNLNSTEPEVIAVATPLSTAILRQTNLTNLIKDQPNKTDLSIYQFADSFPSLNLSKRETECYYFLLRGNSAKQIARIMYVSNKTIENFIHNIKIKLGVRTRSQLYDFAISNQLLHIVPFSVLDLYSVRL